MLFSGSLTPQAIHDYYITYIYIYTEKKSNQIRCASHKRHYYINMHQEFMKKSSPSIAPVR